MTNAASSRQIAASKKRAAEDLRDEAQVITNLMSHPVSRKWVWKELAYAQIFLGTENLDPYAMAFEKGRRNTGLRLLTMVLRHCPEAYVTMTNENSSANLKEQDDGESHDSPDQ